jgi:hypothetical protein
MLPYVNFAKYGIMNYGPAALRAGPLGQGQQNKRSGDTAQSSQLVSASGFGFRDEISFTHGVLALYRIARSFSFPSIIVLPR